MNCFPKLEYDQDHIYKEVSKTGDEFGKCGVVLMRAELHVDADEREDDTQFILEGCEDTEGSGGRTRRHMSDVYVCQHSSVCIYKDCEQCDPVCM